MCHEAIIIVIYYEGYNSIPLFNVFMYKTARFFYAYL